MEDKTLQCVDCGEPFVFTEGEQQFYAERGLTELPKRCKPCRGARRRRLGRRRRQEGRGTMPPPEAMVDADPEAGPEEPASVEAPPRTFWDERPDWVREAMQKASAAASSGNGNGAAGGEDAQRRRRRRARRRRRRGRPEALDRNQAASPDRSPE